MTRGRKREALRAPAPDIDLTGFSVTAANDLVYRAHSTNRDPWYFSSNGAGRFDIKAPNGTCYLANDVETAIRESLGGLLNAPDQSISATQASKKCVSTLRLPSGLKFADVNHSTSVRSGITREINTSVNYSLANLWAAAFHNEGFDGICYQTRFTTTSSSNAFAMFGHEGPQNLPVVELNAYSGADACALAGIAVVANTASKAVEIIEPPGQQKAGNRLR